MAVCCDDVVGSVVGEVNANSDYDGGTFGHYEGGTYDRAGDDSD